jgi:hypothetical protein
MSQSSLVLLEFDQKSNAISKGKAERVNEFGTLAVGI